MIRLTIELPISSSVNRAKEPLERRAALCDGKFFNVSSSTPVLHDWRIQRLQFGCVPHIHLGSTVLMEEVSSDHGGANTTCAENRDPCPG